MRPTTLAVVMGVVSAVLMQPPVRREVGGWAPTWDKEWRAAKRLAELGVLDSLIDCLLLYLLLVHSGGVPWSALMVLRKRVRARHRPQAMGTSGLGVDLDLGLRSLIEIKLGFSLQSVVDNFTTCTEFAGWTAEDIMRVAFRRGLQLQVFPMYVVRWYAEASSNLCPPTRIGQVCCSRLFAPHVGAGLRASSACSPARCSIRVST